MPTCLKLLLAEVNRRLGTSCPGVEYNGVLVTEYVNGQDYISAHSDDEPDVNHAAGVLTLSWGAERTFRVRDRTSKRIVCDTVTKPYHALLMEGRDFQSIYTHEIPRQANVVHSRISFTFRVHT
jgi:alkylated DNA repair dioxygenase AlkB